MKVPAEKGHELKGMKVPAEKGHELSGMKDPKEKATVPEKCRF